MALEQAGVELIAKNYRQYLDILRQIDKTQQQVFRNPGRGAEQAHNGASNAARRHAQQVSILQRLYKDLGTIIIASLSVRGLEKAFDLANQAFDFQRITAQFENLAHSGGTSAAVLAQAFQRAAQGGISNARAWGAAAAAMRLEVAGTPQELEELVRLAVAMRPAGKSAADAVDEFVTALGRRSLLVLDNFQISSRQARMEMERLSQTRYGKPLEDLDKATSDLLFMQAALSVARRQYAAMGGASVEVVSNMDRLNASLENTGTILGQTILPLASELAATLEKATVTLSQIVIMSRANAARQRAEIEATNRLLEAAGKETPRTTIGAIGQLSVKMARKKLTPEEEAQVAAAGQAAYEEMFKDAAKALGIFTDESDQAAQAQNNLTPEIEDNTEAVKALQSAVEEAQSIYRSFARAQDDALRKAARQADQLQRKQAKELVKLQKDLQKDLGDLDKDRAEDQIKAQKDTDKALKRSKDDLYKQLRQAEERYQLSVMQGRRRFNLQDRRLRAEGDILALQQLREDYDLQQKEEKENFDLSQKQQKESGQDRIQQQQQDQQEQLREIQADIEKRRQELLTSYDDELAQLQEAHAEQREEQARSLAEQLEDLRLNRERQLEDLGYHMAQQQDITREGAQNVAEELEKVFGVDGVADLIMQGYAERTSGRFSQLFADIERTVTAGQEIDYSQRTSARRPRARGAIPMQHGFSGIVTGPQTFYTEPGVREFVYAAPLSGGGGIARNVMELGGAATINVTGLEGASPGTVDAAVGEIIGLMELAQRRLTRRG